MPNKLEMSTRMKDDLEFARNKKVGIFSKKKDRQIEGIQIFTIVFVFTHFFSIVFDLPSI